MSATRFVANGGDPWEADSRLTGQVIPRRDRVVNIPASYSGGSGSHLGPETSYPDWCFLWFSSVPPGEFRDIPVLTRGVNGQIHESALVCSAPDHEEPKSFGPQLLAAWEPIRPKTCRALLPNVADREGGGSGGQNAVLALSTMVAWLHGANRRIQSRDSISYQLIHFIYIYIYIPYVHHVLSLLPLNRSLFLVLDIFSFLRNWKSCPRLLLV
jgi:hypothetical protein